MPRHHVGSSRLSRACFGRWWGAEPWMKLQSLVSHETTKPHLLPPIWGWASTRMGKTRRLRSWRRPKSRHSRELRCQKRVTVCHRAFYEVTWSYNMSQDFHKMSQDFIGLLWVLSCHSESLRRGIPAEPPPLPPPASEPFPAFPAPAAPPSRERPPAPRPRPTSAVGSRVPARPQATQGAQGAQGAQVLRQEMKGLDRCCWNI